MKKRRTTEELEQLVKKVDSYKSAQSVSTTVACEKMGIAPAQYYTTRGAMGMKKIQAKRAYNKKPKFETIVAQEPKNKDKIMLVVGSIAQVRALLNGGEL